MRSCQTFLQLMSAPDRPVSRKTFSLSTLFFWGLSTGLAAESRLQELDWVSRDQLTAGQAEQIACQTACSGVFIEPERTDIDANRSPQTSPIRGEASATEINTEAETARMEGDVMFTQGWRQLQSELVEIDRSSGTLKLEGDVRIREPGMLLVGDRAYVDSMSNELEISHAEYLFHEQRIRGSASNINRSPNQGIAIQDASYTTCEPGDEAWVLYAKNININEQTGRASASGVKIAASGVPVFYAPYFQFIVDNRRATGLLYPSIGYSNDEGLEYSQPVYIHIAPNQDATLNPRLTSKRSRGIEAEHRLLTRHSFTRSAGVFFPDDDINPEHSDQRWAAAITHRTKQKTHWGKWAAQIDFASISDDDFLEDWDTHVVHADDRDIYLHQHARFTVELDHWQFSAAARDHQNLIDRNQNQYRALPIIAFNGKYPLGKNLSLSLNHQWASFDHDQDNLIGSNALEAQIADDGTWVTGDRSHVNWALSWNHQGAWGHIKPKLAAHYLAYELDAALPHANDTSPDLFAPELSIDSALNFERQLSIGNQSFSQTLMPRAYYLYRDSEPQNQMPIFDTALATNSLEQQFRDNRFVGGDRLEDANRLSLGLWSRLYSHESQREILSLGIGQTYYFEDTTANPETQFLPVSNIGALLAEELQRLGNQQRNRSEIMSEAHWQMTESIGIKGKLFWDDQDSHLQRSRLELQYRPTGTESFLKLAYTQEDDQWRLLDANQNGLLEQAELTSEQIEQVSLSGQWSINDRWKALFLWREDLENNRNLDRVLGVSYQSCCWNLSLSWRSELERIDRGSFIAEQPRKDSGIVLRFEFVGLGGLGTSAQSLLDDRSSL